MMYCTFSLAGEQYAVPMLEVQEVIQQQVLTPVPMAPPLLRGLMNLRGTLVVSIDMRRRLQLPPVEDESESIQIIVNVGGSLFGLMVDQMGGRCRTSSLLRPSPTRQLSRRLKANHSRSLSSRRRLIDGTGCRTHSRNRPGTRRSPQGNSARPA